MPRDANIGEGKRAAGFLDGVRIVDAINAAVRRRWRRRFAPFRLQAREPEGVAPSLAQKPHAFAQGFFIARDAPAMRRIETVSQSVEQFAPRRRALGQNTIHVGRDPCHSVYVGHRALAAHGFAVDMHDAAIIVGFIGIAARADMKRAKSRLQFGGNRPRLAGITVLQIGKRAAFQSASGNEQTDRFEKIGFAAAVRAGQNHRLRQKTQADVAIVAEIGQRHTTDAKGGEGALHQVLKMAAVSIV